MRRGFTLLEVLLAVALSALVFALLGGVVIGIIDAEKRITERSQATKYAAGILNAITADLEACYIYQRESGFFAKSGDEPEMHFITSRLGPEDPDTGQRYSTTEISYILKKTEDSENFYTLYRRVQSPVDDEPFAGGSGFEVYDRILEFKAEYQNADGGWLEEWSAIDRLPVLVKVYVRLVDAEAIPEDTDPERVREYTTTILIPCGGQDEEEVQ